MHYKLKTVSIKFTDVLIESKILGTEVIISFSHPEDKTTVKLIKTVNNIE